MTTFFKRLKPSDLLIVGELVYAAPLIAEKLTCELKSARKMG